MTDGNKESTKELLSTLRTIVAISLSILIFSSNRSLFPVAAGLETTAYNIAFAALVLSIIGSIYVCLVVIAKLRDECDGIVDRHDVKISSFVSLVCFLSGTGLLIAIQNI